MTTATTHPVAAPSGSAVSRWLLPVVSLTQREVVRFLSERGAKHLYIDGGKTIQRFLAQGLIQQLIITRVPILLGDGIPLFGPLPKDVMLRHISTRDYPNGLVQSHYEVEGAFPEGKEYTIVTQAVEVPVFAMAKRVLNTPLRLFAMNGNDTVVPPVGNAL